MSETSDAPPPTTADPGDWGRGDGPRLALVYICDDLSRLVFEDVENGDVVGEIPTDGMVSGMVVRVQRDRDGHVLATMHASRCYTARYFPLDGRHEIRVDWLSISEVAVVSGWETL